MEYVTLTPETITAINREFLNTLKTSGLRVVSEDDAALLVALNKTRTNVMRRKHVSPNTIEKYGLLNGVTTRHTVVNMVKDGRITKGEWFKDVSGNYQILTIAIRRLNGE